jgi:hypothetical protein
VPGKLDNGGPMKRLKLGTNFTVFLLFFGVATLEAFQTRNWLKAIFWVAIGMVFLFAPEQKFHVRD